MECKVENLDGNRVASEMFVKMFHAFMECSDEVQASIREMVEIVTSDDATDDEVEAAFSTIEDALFPGNHNGDLGVDLETLEPILVGEAKKALRELKDEENTFSERLGQIMDEKGVTQQELAKMVGVGQPAISMMLARECRPQRRTVYKIAEALKVSVEELWPGMKAD